MAYTGAVGGEYGDAAITMEHIVAEGHAWGLASAAGLAEETLATVLQVADTETPHKRAYPGLSRDIARSASNLLAGRAIGASSHHH